MARQYWLEDTAYEEYMAYMELTTPQTQPQATEEMATPPARISRTANLSLLDGTTLPGILETEISVKFFMPEPIPQHIQEQIDQYNRVLFALAHNLTADLSRLFAQAIRQETERRVSVQESERRGNMRSAMELHANGLVTSERIPASVARDRYGFDVLSPATPVPAVRFEDTPRQGTSILREDVRQAVAGIQAMARDRATMQVPQALVQPSDDEVIASLESTE